jgi:hypothetical protein
MTILERKQLAAHQRRVGPDTVGYKNYNLYLKKLYHTNNCDTSKRAIIDLYFNRKAPVTKFKDEIVFIFTKLLSLIRKSDFSEFKDKGGIYKPFLLLGIKNIRYFNTLNNKDEFME